MPEKNQQSSSLQSTTTNSADPHWGNKLSPRVENANIEFNKGVTPFVEKEDEVIDEHELQHHQQQVADDIQLQLTGVIRTLPVGNEPLLQPNQSMDSGNTWQRFLAVVSNSKYITLIVILIHVFIISLALLFGRVDISGMTEVPVTQQSTKPLPPLKSYLITQAEYDKLIERAKSNAAVPSTELEPKSGISEETDGQKIESEQLEPIVN
ncbi:hypothetical protein H5202_19685 [Shewanella sp. SG41-4]|uniref:hypothetical protein n=1 Tax=Shewanella sp. SG41-4 TaxID=2760976 RepID=UPI0015FFF0B6|nr:hypothetical protein [Shewanella sp. SG41-4]MBB1440841.1 hypothetical protein [Shewanella sp. SG41-4]